MKLARCERPWIANRPPGHDFGKNVTGLNRGSRTVSREIAPEILSGRIRKPQLTKRDAIGLISSIASAAGQDLASQSVIQLPNAALIDDHIVHDVDQGLESNADERVIGDSEREKDAHVNQTGEHRQ